MTARASSVLELLAGWVPRQRWYAGKGAGVPELARLGGLRFDDDGRPAGPAAEVDVVFLQLTAPDGVNATYQVPITLRSAPAEHQEFLEFLHIVPAEIKTIREKSRTEC